MSMAWSCVFAQEELTRNHCRNKSIDVWQRGVDTDIFNPKFRNAGVRFDQGSWGIPLEICMWPYAHRHVSVVAFS